jgi:hypothetical protein
MNVKKTKVVVFEARKSMCHAFQYEGEAIEQLNSFKYLGVELHGTKGMQAAIQWLAMSGKKTVFALRRRYANPLEARGINNWLCHICNEERMRKTAHL